MNVSKVGVDLIKSFEGFVGHPYQDEVGVWTIGYGHTEGVGPRSKHITEKQASELLRKDLDKKYAPPVSRLGIKLNQNEFDALVSFVYNLGPGILERSHTIGVELRRPRKGDGSWKRNVANAMLLYDHAGSHVSPGLTRRRRAEHDLFLKPVKK
jgi:lysozyme